MDDVVEMIDNRDRDRRLLIFRRADGSFGVADEFYCKEIGYDCWLPQSLPGSRYATPEIARQEVLNQGEWVNMPREQAEGEPSDA
jgi:hypothetical protein